MEAFTRSVELRIRALLEQQPRVLLAIDGRCGAGKTTLAACLGDALHANVIHMDDFFLRPEQRTAARLQEPGGNVDYARFINEVLLPLSRGEAFDYCPYDCHTGTLCAPVHVPIRQVTIVEGAYSCHPAFGKAYDLTVFLSIPADTQLARICTRNGKAAAKRFADIWIPLEERYFSCCDVAARADMINVNI